MLKWMKDVKESNYNRAYDFLKLDYDEENAKHYVTVFRNAKLAPHRANDILRAAKLEAAPLDDPGVREQLIKCVKGEEISPVLLQSLVVGLLIVNGFHRISMCYHLDPFMEIPAKLI